MLVALVALAIMTSDSSAQNDNIKTPYLTTLGNTPAPAQVHNTQADPYALPTIPQVYSTNPYLLPNNRPASPAPVASDIQRPQQSPPAQNTLPAPTNHMTRRIPPVPPGTVRPPAPTYQAVPAAPANPYTNQFSPNTQPASPNTTVAPNNTAVAPNLPTPRPTGPATPTVETPAQEQTRPFGQQGSNAMHQFVKPPEPFQQYKPGEILASVGQYVILARDIEPLVMQMLIRRARTITRAQLPQVKDEITKEVLEQIIKQKLLYCDARNSLPEESMPNIEEQLMRRFDEFELPRLLKAAKVDTEQQLDDLLKQMGSSIEHRRTTFLEQAVAAQWVQEQMQSDLEITYSDLVSYYQANREEFNRKAETTWEHLMIRHSLQPSKRDGWAAIARMGNEALTGSFAKVAKEKSHGPTSAEGGRRTYPTKSILSSEIESAIKELPVGQMSPIIEDFRGFHIIRVVERRPEGIAPFLEVQDDIEKKIKLARAKVREDEYLAKLRRNFHVWTVFDGGTTSAGSDGTQIGSLPGQGTRQ